MKLYIRSSSATSQSAIAKKVAEYAVSKFSAELDSMKAAILDYDSTIPSDAVIQNIQDLIYKKYFSHFKKTSDRNGDPEGYGLPPKDLDSCLEYVDKWLHRDLTVENIFRSKTGKVIVCIATQFIDYVMYSYYVVYDYETGSTDVTRAASRDFRSKQGKEIIYN